MNQLECMHYTASSRLTTYINNRRRFPISAGIALGLSMVMTSMQALAQNWQVDPQLSVARLSLGSHSNAVQIGVAHVSGEVLFDSKDLAHPTVKIRIVPGSTTGPDYAEMSFASKTSTITSDGKLRVTGDLLLTRTVRSVTAEPDEAYAGPRYGDPVTHTSAHRISLVFSDPRQSASRNGTMHVSGTISVNRSDFPLLLSALIVDDWPTQLVNNQRCEAPLTIGEDYSGIKCTGTVIASVSNVEVPMGTGEGFSGFQPAITPDPDHGALILDLKLHEITSAASVDSDSTTTASLARGKRHTGHAD